MANEEHLKILRQGVEAWNKWREAERDETPDLTGANLSGMTLAGIDLTWATLEKANCEGTTLWGANMGDANLNGADLCAASLRNANLQKSCLQGASLYSADLTDADLSNSSLSDADLRDAILYWTTFFATDLRKAQFQQARIHEARFTNTDLAVVIGLEECFHFGPSIVDWRTVERSSGLSEKFLRGCGWSDWQIEAAKLCQPGLSDGQITDISYAIANKLTSNPYTYYPCFISHSHADKPFARWLHDQLQARGIRCWLDEKQLLPGDDTYDSVDKGIREYDKFLLCASRASLTSWWVDFEVTAVFAKEQRVRKRHRKKMNLLVTLDLDGYLFSKKCRNGKQQQLLARQAANFKGWKPGSKKFGAELDRVVKALRADDRARPQPPPSLLK